MTAYNKQSFKDKTFKLTNSMGGASKVEFKPAAAPVVRFYSCGPTVYGPLHIGNARALCTADLFFRWLSHIGYQVNYVRNFTDVDDKIIQKAKDTGRNPETDSAVVAQHFLEYAKEDMRRLELAAPTKECRVTESMDEIISLVKSLEERGHAYAANGEVLFSIGSFPTYGKLSGKNVEELQAGARVEVASYKKNPMDFSLWKKHKVGEPHWPSPWGDGRPGWHIECSAMAKRWLGETIDLHHGGQDLIFPHHENEIAQSEAGNGKSFCAHWVHNAFLTIGKEKMSKSLGNVFEIRTFIERYGAEILRYEFIKHHYRTPFDFNAKALSDSLNELERIYEAKRWAVAAANTQLPAGDGQGGSSSGSGDVWAALVSTQNIFTAIENDLFNDLNTPGAIASVFTHVRAINAAESKAAGRPGGTAAQTAQRKQVAEAFLQLLDKGIKPILNVFGEDPEKMLQLISRIKQEFHAADKVGAAVLDDAQIQDLLDQRKSARAAKDFAGADVIRKQLDEAGILILDSPTGTTWKRK